MSFFGESMDSRYLPLPVPNQLCYPVPYSRCSLHSPFSLLTYSYNLFCISCFTFFITAATVNIIRWNRAAAIRGLLSGEIDYSGGNIRTPEIFKSKFHNIKGSTIAGLHFAPPDVLPLISQDFRIWTNIFPSVLVTDSRLYHLTELIEAIHYRDLEILFGSPYVSSFST